MSDRITIAKWNNRPEETALRARIDKLESALKKLSVWKEGQMISGAWVSEFAKARCKERRTSMSKPKFTPGPWKAKGLTVFHMEPEKESPKNTLANGYVCSCFSTRNWEGMKEEANANAALIAAVPEMYELLERIKNEMECTPEWYRFINDVEAVLKEARGEQ